MVIGENKIYNLMDTNGRRNDVTNAIRGYLIILDEIMKYKCNTWDCVPKSLAQFYFYDSAVKMFADVFKKHEPYDLLIDNINKNEKFKKAIIENDIKWLREHHTQYIDLINLFDKGIEDRARHYTSNLVKLGFADSNRNISDVGRMIIDTLLVKKDELERLIPIDETNIIYLRQLLKLRIYNTDRNKYYSPFCLALYMLIKNKRISERDFFFIIQELTPYDDISSIDALIEDFNAIIIEQRTHEEMPEILKTSEKIDKELFYSIYTNKKSNITKEIYWDFYEAIYDFYKKQDDVSLINLLTTYKDNKNYIDKAFGNGETLFYIDKKNTKINVNDFIKNNEIFFNKNNLNQTLYQMFVISKHLDGIKEYSDTTKRIFNATGIISFANGYVQLAYKELIEKIIDLEQLKKLIGGSVINGDIDYIEYEDGINSYYCSSHSLVEIFHYSDHKIDNIINSIKTDFNDNDVNNIANTIKEKRRKEFEEYIKEKYPINVVKDLLYKFSDRTKDEEIKKIVSEEASIPTIYEYIVGIAWYYFSNKTINLLESYNLSLSANFEPLVHAGGGQGDIVIYSQDKVVMIEATLMNKSAQKRGEWEPVLRHSTNLKIEEEENFTNRLVTTFFISDQFDNNTINIWKAVASVPLESSNEKDKFTRNVVIMPINNNELSALMDMSEKYDLVLNKVHELFEVKGSTFDLKWRDKFINKVLVDV